MKKSLLILFSFVFILSSCTKEEVTPDDPGGSTKSYVFITDQNFERELIAYDHDSEGILDGKILLSDARAIVSLGIGASRGATDDQKIKNLKGIETFTNLKEFRLVNSLVSSITFQTNLKLELLSLETNPNLTNIDIQLNVKLKEIGIYENNTDLIIAGLNTLPELEELSITEVNLDTDFQIANSISLKDLRLDNCGLTSLDISANTLLEILHCNNNQLTSLDISNNTLLNGLTISNNPSLTCIKISAGQVIQSVSKDAGQELRDDCN